MAKDYSSKIQNASDKFFTKSNDDVQEVHVIQQVQQAQQEQKTQGKKGFKMQRINMAFTPDNIEFIRIMAKLKGQTMTQYVNEILDNERNSTVEIYHAAKQLADKLQERGEDN